jgi:hypothetical protein
LRGNPDVGPTTVRVARGRAGKWLEKEKEALKEEIALFSGDPQKVRYNSSHRSTQRTKRCTM